MTDGVARVVNVDPFESETAAAPRASSPADTEFASSPTGPTSVERARKGMSDDRLRSADELWPWFALPLFGLLMLEFLLANRTAA
ncbi:MAG: hypothetical protein WKF75_00475 [Singulisphaera sp.]